jgi:hypothetical protein
MDFLKMHCDDMGWMELALENSRQILVTSYAAYALVRLAPFPPT